MSSQLAERLEPTSSPTLLIVDDTPENRALLVRRFGRHGFQTVEAESGEQALELIRRRHFDLVLLDVVMPSLDGIAVLQQIRQERDPTQLPVVMVTGKTAGIDLAEALEAGANDYITKPVDFGVALARVRVQLECKATKEALARVNTALREFNDTLEQRVAERTSDLVAANARLKIEIAERECSQAQIHYLAHHDNLTGLGNRALLRQQLHQAMSRPMQMHHGVAVLFIDLDGFKSINDTLGHSIGDGLLKGVAKRLSETVREEDKLARLGGDEFAVIQSGAEQPTSAAMLASRLIHAISRPHIVDGHQLMIGASIGVAVASENKNDPEDILKSADLAMYRAKADGRGTYRFFEPEMDARAQARRSMETMLRAADIETAFEVYYQPLVDLERKGVTCFEALLRWHHPEKGFMEPSKFIPLAEEIGVIVPLGEWVLRRACADASTWPDNVSVAVNLSPVQFNYPGLPAAVRSALESSGLPASRLELEITESVLLKKTDFALSILNELRDLGVTISMDDFGTGYSSLSYLRSFCFDKLKIDRTFIHDLTTNGTDSLAIVRAITELGRNFDMTVVAEGVETLEQLRCLQNEGCGQMQGFFFSPPRPASDIPSLVERIALACRSTMTMQPVHPTRTVDMEASLAPL